MKKIKYGICSWAFPVNGPHSCKIAAELGLEGIELDLGEYSRNFPLRNKTIQNAYKEEREKWGITFPSIAVNALTEFGMTNKKNTEKGKIARSAIEIAIDVAINMGIRGLQLPSFEDGEVRDEEDFENLLDILSYACDLTAGTDIVVASENILSAEMNKRIFKELNRSNLKIYFDLQNYSLFRGFNTPNMIDELFEYIYEIHAKDGANGSMSGSLLGTGDAEFYKSAKKLKTHNYSGWINLENYYDQYPLSLLESDPFVLLQKDLGILKSTFL